MRRVYKYRRTTFPSVSSQERRAAVVPRINRSSIARQTIVVFLDPVCIGFNTFVLPKKRPGQMFAIREVENERSCLGRGAAPSLCPSPRRLASPRSAPLCPASPNPAVAAPPRLWWSGFWARQFFLLEAKVGSTIYQRTKQRLSLAKWVIILLQQ